MWFQRDKFSAHDEKNESSGLKLQILEVRSGVRGPILRYFRPSNLNPIYFSLSAHLMENIYAVSPATIKDTAAECMAAATNE
jgi:hypothetical protein